MHPTLRPRFALDVAMIGEEGRTRKKRPITFFLFVENRNRGTELNMKVGIDLDQGTLYVVSIASILFYKSRPAIFSLC